MQSFCPKAKTLLSPHPQKRCISPNGAISQAARQRWGVQYSASPIISSCRENEGVCHHIPPHYTPVVSALNSLVMCRASRSNFSPFAPGLATYSCSTPRFGARSPNVVRQCHKMVLSIINQNDWLVWVYSNGTRALATPRNNTNCEWSHIARIFHVDVLMLRYCWWWCTPATTILFEFYIYIYVSGRCVNVCPTIAKKTNIQTWRVDT